MLFHTFCHIPSIGEKTEKKIWQEGIFNWDDALTNPLFRKILPGNIADRAYSMVARSYEKIDRKDSRFFNESLHNFNRWRIYSHFRSEAVFLDIETSGLNPPNDYITVITLFDGKKIKTYIHGINMYDFIDDISHYQIIITFNGKCFDLPFIERYFGIKLTQIHFDLRFMLKSLGLSGGLKVCEKSLGIDRGKLKGIDGYMAVLLWQKYLEGCTEALETLIAYNVEDTVNLEKLMVYFYNFKVSELSFPQLIIEEPRKKIQISSHIYPEVINEIRYERLRFHKEREGLIW
ncbi:MAG: ribonuclease H-like domain-containing protein [Candidatus Atribacteria bacterium]|nr:ribonuclease H-like domain-containing protein [Candidatus Atribacteria bacterium]